MRHWLSSKVGWLWLLALLALPNCAFDSSGLGLPAGGIGTHFDPGDQPHSSVIFCDIENDDVAPHCATETDLSIGIPLAQAAMALVKGQSSNVGLDYSPAAISDLGCDPGQPVAITFRGPFPAGASTCLNCGGVIGPIYENVNAACIDKCKDLNGSGSGDFCADGTHARASTNAGSCFDDACTSEGALHTVFEDPRATPEPVSWVDQVGTSASGPDSNTLTRTAAATGDFDAGAASSQTIESGDGYVEFTVTETDKARVLGLSNGASDSDPGLDDIGFGARLSTDGHVFVFEGGTLVPGPNPDMSFATYESGERVRVTVRDRFDGTADVVYSLIPANCAGAGCEGMVLRTAGPGSYPFRVDASLREQGATLTNVRLVRIK